MKKKGIIIILIVILLIIGGYLWKNKGEKISGKDVVKIGVILPLTGNVAFVGKPLKEGIETRLSEFNNSENTIKIILAYEDSKAAPTVGKNALMKLYQQNIKIVIGPASSGVTSVLIPDADKYKITLLSPTASKQSLAIKNDYFFRNELSDGIGAKLQAQIAVDSLKWKSMSVVYVNNEYGLGVKSIFESTFKSMGGTVVNSLGFDVNQSDFSTISNKVKMDESQVVFIIAENQYVNIIKDLREQGCNKQIYATPVFENQDNISRLGLSAEGILYSYYGNFNPDGQNENQQKFIELYKSKYNQIPSYYSALGYESLDLIIKALELNRFKLENIKDSFYRIQNYKSITGDLSFNEYGDVVKPVSIKTVKNGKFIFKSDF